MRMTYSGLATLAFGLLAPLLPAPAALAPRSALADDAPPAAAAAENPPAAKAKIKKATLASVMLKEDYAEGTAPAGLFGELKPHLRDVIERLDKAAKDDKVSGVVLRIRSPELGLGKVDELRGVIGRLRTAGKKVYADVDSVMTKDYLIAAACDEVIIPPSGSLMLTGLAAEISFYKSLLDKLGVQADIIQVGDFKGAAEPFTRTEMSAEFRQQFESVIEDYYSQMVSSIAKDRHLDEPQVKALIDEGLFTPDRAKEAKLVDRVCYEDELVVSLKESLNAEEVVLDRQYGKKKLDTDYSGFGGFMKLMEAMMGVEAPTGSSKSPKIALVYAVGPIMSGESDSGFSGENSVGSDTLVKALRDAKHSDRVKAIVLRVDSPGGSALASDLIWREVATCDKPFVVSMGNVAASGGYYISMAADKIFAEPGTLTGSIGVVGGKMALRGLLDKVGVNVQTISRGKNASSFSAVDPFSPSERDAWHRMMKDTYHQFTSKAAEGRKMDADKLEKLAQGRIFTGRMAVENGLVDKLGTLTDALAEAKTLAGLKADEKIELQILPKPKNFFEQLFDPSGDMDVHAQIPAELVVPRELLAAWRQVRLLQQVFTPARPVATMLPYQINIR
ncbi:MAG TPA: signal peptide peptidase SppA [Pirellulales bacterium]|jgi:protease-4|nr:signal peptide peptidase SppA [Pirellulales bacterium]